MTDRTTPQISRRRWWYLLLIIPFIVPLWVPFYNSASPELAGFPFFYWYQLLWVIIGAIITAIVYFATGRSDLR
ncbi:MAG TPA: DUF3311 domain-containing protein [Chloroflexota bacterium]|nr:DUF3311 domain-containing protein [Chloroflexota bacterium]